MASERQCGCLTPCNCVVDEDGYWAERPQDGRRNTVVAGTGTTSDPLTISFMQSEHFRPRAGEVKAVNFMVPNADADEVVGSDVTTVYESPGHALITTSLSTSVILVTVFGNFFAVGASASFDSHATGIRRLTIATDNPLINPGIARPLAANEQLGNAGRQTHLVCSGFAPGYLDKTGFLDGIAASRLGVFVVSLYQTSGAPLNASQVKFWVATI